MTRVVLGNRHALDSSDNGATFFALPKGKRATVVDFDESTSFLDMIAAVTSPQGIWVYHAVGPDGVGYDDSGKEFPREVIHADAKPAWVASSNAALAQVLSEAYGGIQIRKLEDTDGHPLPEGLKSKKRGGGSSGPASTLLPLMLAMPIYFGLYRLAQLALKVNAGNDFQYNQMAGSASATAVGKWVALTANTTAPAAGDTTLTGEITTASGGLIRKAGTPAHTTGAASYTITTVFTANGSDVLPVTIGKRGIFDAVTAGNLIFETLVSPTATLSASGDNLTLTDTISM
jgi:hypothetical protein